PTMMPTPIPEPMTARPKARGASCPTMFTGMVPFERGLGDGAGERSVLFGDRELDVDGGQDGEDVRLESGDEQFEHREGDAEGEGSDAEQADEVAVGEHREEEELGRGEAEHEQHVPG